MVKLIVGKKGTGKTKRLIEQANAAAEATKGCVICIEKGKTLNSDIIYKVRLVDTDSYKVLDAGALYGFVAGISASNYDITDVFIDSTLKICKDAASLEEFLLKVNDLTATGGFHFTATVSLAPEECPESLRGFII